MSRWACSLLLLSLSCGTLRSHPIGEVDEPNAWEKSGKFEGDIIFEDGVEPLNGLKNPVYYWPAKTLVYKLDAGLDATQRSKIMSAISDYQTNTCIKFRQATSTDKDYVYIQGTESGCYSAVGRKGGKQTLNYGPGCFSHGTLMHELLHSLGFYHMQSATNRDDFVTIVWGNIQAGKEHNFEKYPSTVITDFGVTYDYGSVMHYQAAAFSTNGKATIIPKDPNATIGQRTGLSTKDIKKLQKMYGCA